MEKPLDPPDFRAQYNNNNKNHLHITIIVTDQKPQIFRE